MNCKTLNIFQNPNFKQLHTPLFCKQSFHLKSSVPVSQRISRRNKVVTACISPGQEILLSQGFEVLSKNDVNLDSISLVNEEKQEPTKIDQVETQGFGENESIWKQMVEIVKFSGPATGLWLCGPLMSLIDTVVIGQSSSVELAALGDSLYLSLHSSVDMNMIHMNVLLMYICFGYQVLGLYFVIT